MHAARTALRGCTAPCTGACSHSHTHMDAHSLHVACTHCSADGTARLYNSMTGVCSHTLVGHEGEISKVAFNPQVGLGEGGAC